MYKTDSYVTLSSNWKRYSNLYGNLAEWLRRKIRNLLGSARAGSNPAVVVTFFLLPSVIHIFVLLP